MVLVNSPLILTPEMRTTSLFKTLWQVIRGSEQLGPTSCVVELLRYLIPSVLSGEDFTYLLGYKILCAFGICMGL